MNKTKYIYPLLTLLSFFVLSNKTIAQTKLNLTEVDKLTYEYYNSQKWDELIEIGKDAQNYGISFYYLNYRMGIAYYSLKKYRKAIPYFENILSITPNDTIAKEYIYYSYLFGGRISDATNMLYSLEKKHRKKIEFHNTNSLFNGLGLEYKYYSFGDYAINETVNSEIVQKVRNSMSYFSIDMMNYSRNNSTFYFNASIIGGSNSIYDIEYSPEVIDETLKQYQFYFSWKKRLSKGTNINLGLTYMRENLKWYDYQNSSGNGFGNINSGTLIFDGVTNNFVGVLSISKSIANFDLSLGSSISSINEESQAQPFIDIIWYPFSNKSFYSNTNVSYQYNFNNYNDNVVFKQSFVAELSDKFSIKAYGLYGKIYNYVDNNGLSIYNNLDAIEYWYGLSANYYFNTTTQLYMSYRNDRQTNNYTDNNFDKETSYNVNSVLVGIRFNF